LQETAEVLVFLNKNGIMFSGRHIHCNRATDDDDDYCFLVSPKMNNINCLIHTILVQSWTWRQTREYYTTHNRLWNPRNISSANKSIYTNKSI